MTVQTLYTAATGMEALETKLDVIANNMANINTTGFKKDRGEFRGRILSPVSHARLHGCRRKHDVDRHRSRPGLARFQHAVEPRAGRV